MTPMRSCRMIRVCGTSLFLRARCRIAPPPEEPVQMAEVQAHARFRCRILSRTCLFCLLRVRNPRGDLGRADRWCAQAPLVLSVDRFHLAIPAFTHTTQCCRIFLRRRRSSLKLWNIMPTNAIANVQRTSRTGSPRYDPAPNRNATPKPQLNCLLCKSAIS